MFCLHFPLGVTFRAVDSSSGKTAREHASTTRRGWPRCKRAAKKRKRTLAAARAAHGAALVPGAAWWEAQERRHQAKEERRREAKRLFPNP